MLHCVACMMAHMPADERDTDAKPRMADLLDTSEASDWRELDPENTVYLELASGRVVIELAPDFAPNHAANIKALARERYWDELRVIRVNDNYVAQFGDPFADDITQQRAIQLAQRTLAAEFERTIDPQLPFTPLLDKDGYASSVGFTNGFPCARDENEGLTWLVHTYGTVSAGRDTDIDSGGGAELTVVIGHAPRQLDRNVTVVGRVRLGMELISALPRGNGTLGFLEEAGVSMSIRAVRVATDLPYAERTALQVLRTDTMLFHRLIESRRNRYEGWFHRPAGYVEIGNVPVPVRLIK